MHSHESGHTEIDLSTLKMSTQDCLNMYHRNVYHLDNGGKQNPIDIKPYVTPMVTAIL